MTNLENTWTSQYLSLMVKLLLPYSTCKMQLLRCFTLSYLWWALILLSLPFMPTQTLPTNFRVQAEWLVSCMATNWACQQDEGHSALLLWYYSSLLTFFSEHLRQPTGTEMAYFHQYAFPLPCVKMDWSLLNKCMWHF